MITIASTDADKAEHAKKRIEEITAEVEVGKVYEGPVTKILDFGALVNLLPGKDGLLHISQIAHERVEKVTDYLKEGQIVKVKVLETDEKGRVKLSMKALLERPAGMEVRARAARRPRRERRGDRGDRGGRDRGDRGDRVGGERSDRATREPQRSEPRERAAEPQPRRGSRAEPARTVRRPPSTRRRCIPAAAQPRVSSERHESHRNHAVRRARSAAPGRAARPRRGRGRGADPRRGRGVNRPDVLQRKGHYPVPPGASDLPGLEVAGAIVGGDAAAMAAAGFKLGDRVCALVAGGGYAELCIAPVGQCLPVPKGLSDVEAATLPETFFTVWSNVFDRGRLQAGETLLVQGGTSGIGVTAIQLAKALRRDA